MPRALAGLLVALALGACNEEPLARRQPAAPLAPPTNPPVLECRFEPVSAPGERARSGFEMCYSSAEPEPWWTRASGHRSSGPTANGHDSGAAEDDGVVPAAYDAGAPPEPPEPEGEAPCPEGMVLIDGMYCPSVRHKCLRYLDEGGGRFLKKHRCAEYDEHPVCASDKQHRRFCIDRDEYVAEGATLPLVEQSWTGAKELCESLGKRLCFESEWELACEGEQMLPYPYGFARDAKRCNHDQTDLTRRGKLRDLRVAPDDLPQCVSPFGVRNMVGNVDEWTVRDGFVRPWRASLRGGWWLAGRNNCRAATTGHDEYYLGPQTGFRCCANAR